MSKPDYLPKNLKLNWLKAFCPECGKEYGYYGHSPDEKPKTCGAFECVYAMADKVLKKRRKP